MCHVIGSLAGATPTVFEKCFELFSARRAGIVLIGCSNYQSEDFENEIFANQKEHKKTAERQPMEKMEPVYQLRTSYSLPSSRR